jgi:hypothetical protein
MSDVWQGPGWWVASDGKWYPPELHPSYQQAAPPVAAQYPYAQYSAPSQTPKQSPKKKVLLGVAALAVVALVAGVLVTTLGSGNSAEAAVTGAVNSAIGDKTAHLVTTATTEVGGKTVSVTGTGAIDFSTSAVQLDMNESVAGQQVSLQGIFLGGIVYESIPEIGQVVPGKSWLSIDLSSLANAAGQTGAVDLGSNPIATLHQLTLQGNTVTDLGPSTVDGQSVESYSVAVDPSAVQNDLASADLPAWLKQAVSQVQVGGITNRVYIDGGGNLVRETAMVTVHLPGGDAVSTNQSMDFSDYGTAVSISAPPADQVVSFSQFLHLATQSALSPTTS